MRLYDATLPFHKGIPTFPGDPEFTIESVFNIESGDEFNLGKISLGTHQGTHVDAPAHYLQNCATVDQIPLSVLIGPGVVLDMRGLREIGRAELEAVHIEKHSRVLFKTDNGALLRSKPFEENYVHLTEDAADLLVEKGVVLVGIDYLSIEKYNNPGAPVHRTLLSAGIVIAEGVDLLDVPAGPCKVYCLPLLISGGDGAPARILIECP